LPDRESEATNGQARSQKHAEPNGEERVMPKVAHQSIGHCPTAEDASHNDCNPNEGKPVPPDDPLPALIHERKETHRTALLTKTIPLIP
jgi:hypothetical protein